MTATEIPVAKPRRRNSGESLGMPFDKPEEGWTRKNGFGVEDVSYDDSTDPEFFRDEVEAVFRHSWLNVGRLIEAPEPGDYFTREIPGLDRSVIVSHGRDGKVRAFHNMCPHRGNKLVWDGDPNAEVCGNTRRFVCKYHGWQFDPEGQLRMLNKENWFFGIDKADYGLTEIPCDTWEGFIFVNFDTNPDRTFREHLGPLADGLAGYPFEKMTQMFKFRSVGNANWKIWHDANIETFHGNTLHYKLIDHTADGPLRGSVGSYFDVLGRNSVWSSAVPVAGLTQELREMRPMERLFDANLWGPKHGPDIGLEELPTYVNVSRHPRWSNDMISVFPNFDILIWEPGWIMTYTVWPVAVDRFHFEARLYFPEPRNASDRLAQELTATEFKEFLMQDANLVAAAQQMLKANIRSTFPLSDEEVLVRKNHQTIRETVEQYRRDNVGAAK